MIGAAGPVAAMLPDGQRLHLHHGPIDLVIQVDASEDERQAAFDQATRRFAAVLEELVGELPHLRQRTRPESVFNGAIARRMQSATLAYRDRFITPMASVAGAVADDIMAEMKRSRILDRAFVNNGGDIALHLSPDTTYTALVVADPCSGRTGARAVIAAEDGVGGIATSGRHGRSHSLGIADAVTVLATSAAAADAAATMIANAVDLPGSDRIHRRPARDLDPDSDLGERLVTVGVASLDAAEIDRALVAGVDYATGLLRTGIIRAACLSLAGQSRVIAASGDRATLQRTEQTE